MLSVSMALGTALFWSYTGVNRVLASSYFAVREIQWVGLHHREAAQMNQSFRDVLGHNLFQVDLTLLQRRLLADPWIETGSIKKLFPDRLLFVVSERQPAAVAVDDPNREVLLSATGKVIERGGHYPSGLPRLIHLHPEAMPVLPLALRWAALLSDRPEAIVDLSDPRDLVIHLAGGVRGPGEWVLHVGGRSEEGLATQQWRYFLEVEDDLRQGASLPLSIDLRFSGKVIVQAREERYL